MGGGRWIGEEEEEEASSSSSSSSSSSVFGGVLEVRSIREPNGNVAKASNLTGVVVTGLWLRLNLLFRRLGKTPLIMFGQRWSVRVRRFFRYRMSSEVDEETYLEIVPHAHQGKPEISEDEFVEFSE